MKAYHADSVRAGLHSLARAGLGYREFIQELIALLGRAVPFDAMCVATLDPATNIMTDSYKTGLHNDGGETFLFHEYALPDVSQMADLARRPIGVAILDEETHGDPASSLRFTEVVRPLLGVRHELRGVARAGGQAWGAYALYRGAGSAGFNAAEADFLNRLETTIATGMRAGIIAAAVERDLAAQEGPAVLLFGQDGALRYATPAAEHCAQELGGNVWDRMPIAVSSLVHLMRSPARNEGTTAPRLRVRGTGGRWYTLHAAPFRSPGGNPADIVVTIEPSRPPEIVPLVMAAYGLTERESTIVQAMLRGDGTHAIAQALHLSPYTVQDHFKTIFGKVGVSSRREVASTVYYGQYFDRYNTAPAISGGPE